MKKEDLKTGMLVETRNGEKYIVLENVYGLQLLATGKGCMELDTHNEDLTYDEPDLDIVKVYALPRDKTCILKISTDDRNLIWKRKDLKVGDIVRVKYRSNYHGFEKGQLLMVGKIESGGWSGGLVECYGRINGDVALQNLKICDIEKVDI